MKRFYLLFLAAVAALAVTACGEKDDPTPGPGPGPEPTSGTDPKMTTLTETTIAGTAIGSDMTVAGLITNITTGKGIAGVPVTDGFSWVKTDANGVYQMKANSRARKVFICTPAAYKIGQYSDGYPNFYPKSNLESGKKFRVDFFLEPLAAAETDFRLLMIGDPQCSTTGEVARYMSETIKKIKSTCEGMGNVYAMTLGDNIFDSNDTYYSVYSAMKNVNAGNWTIPFFVTIGNHDHDATKVSGSDHESIQYSSLGTYVGYFGPQDYSFDRGDVHIISMDNVWVTGTDSSSKSNKKTCTYAAGFSSSQFAWLQGDINNVANPETKTVILCCHIPFRKGAGSGGSSMNKDKNYKETLQLLQKFKEAHIMIGHTHYPQNFINTDYKTAGGKAIYEHIHGAACGAWWSSNCNVTGAPNGFAIYTVSNGNVKNWQAMNSNFDNEFQLRVYDGNQEFTGAKGYKLFWSKTSQKAAGFDAPGFAAASGAFVAEIWNDDNANWKVEFWQNGAKVGDFTRAGDGNICNIPCVSYWYNEGGKTTDTYVNKTASHFWYYKPASGVPSSEKNWEVRATQTIATSGQTNTYTANKLTTDYSTFKKK